MNSTRFVQYPDDHGNSNYTTIHPPKTATDKHWKELPYFFFDVNAGRLRWKNRFEPHLWQKNIRDLYAMATEVDWAIGEIVNELKAQGVYENTMLVFTTDNGDLHGEHGLAEKWYPFEESIKVPLVIQDPRMGTLGASTSSSGSNNHRGTVRTEWTLNVDLAPTLLGAAGLTPSDFMQGRDIAELYLGGGEDGGNGEGKEQLQLQQHQQQQQQRRNLKGGKYNATNTLTSTTTTSTSTTNFEPWRTDWFYEWNMGSPGNASGHLQENFIDAAFALVTDEWKYVYWPQKAYEQLYHRSLDPYDEYDILQNFYLHQEKMKHREYVPEEEVARMNTFTDTNTTPVGDSVRSTLEIYNTLKARFHELKEHVQSGNRI